MRSLQLIRPVLRRRMAKFLMGSVAMGLVVAASAAPPRPDTLRCDADGALAGKGTWESQLGLTVTGSLAERLEYSGLEEGEGGAKTCEFELARKDATTKWETQGQRTRVWLAGNAKADAPDLDLILRGREFEAKFGPGLAALCGAGLGLPQRMTRLANAKCKVER